MIARRFLGDASLLAAGLTGCAAAVVVGVVAYIALQGWPFAAVMDSGRVQLIGLQTGARVHGASPATSAGGGSPQVAARAATAARTLRSGRRTAPSHRSASRGAGGTAEAGSGGRRS